MDEDAQSKQAQPERTDSSDVRAKDVDVSDEQVRFREGLSGGTPTTNPDFSVPVLNPAFTRASPPPPPPSLPPPPMPRPTDVQRDARIKDLEQRLEEATRRMERGADALERVRKARR